MSDNREPDPSWSRYPETILELSDAEVTCTIDLRHQVEPGALAALEQLGLMPEFAVVTAANPLGRQLGGGNNHVRRAQLREALENGKFYFVAADGLSPDRLHREEGFAIRCSQAEAMRLARRFEQSAFFWFDGTTFSIIATIPRAAPIRLPQME